MATENVPPSAGFAAVKPPSPQPPVYREVYRAKSDPIKAAPAAPASLEEVAHSQSNRLFDVRALLAALQALEADEDEDHSAYVDNVRRVARLADDLVNEVQEAFDPFI